MSVTCDIITIGASAGGVGALKKLVAGFPPDLPASVFITVHLGPRTDTLLPLILTANGPLPASHPIDGELIERGRIYVAPPDYHLLFSGGGCMHLGHGPKENMQRPSINAMFRSAADAFGPRVVGVVLSGMLDDGAAGLWEIQQKGGLTLVQSPADALYRSMPDSAIHHLRGSTARRRDRAREQFLGTLYPNVS
jgi:two-component system chemotaxis response regulator CheB